MLFILIGIGAVVGAIGWVYWPQIIGAGWSPTPMRNVEKMLHMAEVGGDDVVYDLGCGDGRIIATAVKKFGARAVGIEADPVRFLYSWMRIKLAGLGDGAKVVWGNFFSHELKDATVITVFLSDQANHKLKEKLKKELIPGTRVVSYYWVFKGWRTFKVDFPSQLYMYRIEE